MGRLFTRQHTEFFGSSDITGMGMQHNTTGSAGGAGMALRSSGIGGIGGKKALAAARFAQIQH